MISREFKLDLVALLSQIVDGQGFLHYGYWPDERADEISLCSLGKAQLAYFDQLAGAIPEGTWFWPAPMGGLGLRSCRRAD